MIKKTIYLNLKYIGLKCGRWNGCEITIPVSCG